MYDNVRLKLGFRLPRRMSFLRKLTLEGLEHRRLLTYTSTLTGTTAVMTGDASGDTLILDASGGLLRHNRFTAGDPGFNSDFDFDTTVSGDQTLAADAASIVTVNAGDGNDVLTVGTTAAPAATVAGQFNLNGEGDTDAVTWDDSADTAGRTINVQGGIFNQVFIPLTGASLSFGATNEAISVLAGGGADTIAVSEAGLTNVSLNAGGDNDTISFADGATLGGTVDGGAGTDTLDYSAYTTAVEVNLGANAPSLVATMQSDQEVPANATTPTGTATLTYDNVAHTFDITVAVSGIDPATVTGFHIHRAPFGVNGDIIVDFGGNTGLVTDGAGGFTFTATDVAIDPLHEAALLGGITYINVHTSPSFPAGQIRGQFFPSGLFVAASGTATGTAGVANVENATGGSGSFTPTSTTFGDSIVGDLNANVLAGGLGNDVIVGARGNDTIQGDAGDDIVAWSNGDGTDVMNGGADQDTVQVNGSLAAADNFAIAAGAGGRVDFDRISPAPFSLDIGTTETLIVNGIVGDDTLAVNSLTGVTDLTQIDLNGQDGSDTFNVTPAAAVTVNVDGDPVRPPTLPGDSLTVVTAGTTSPALTSSSGPLGFSGSYTFGDRQPVNFREVESIAPVGVDLSVTKTDSPDPVTAGTNLTYTITVSNGGLSDALFVNLSDTIPANTTFVSAAQTAGPAFTLTSPPVGGTGTFTASAPALAGGASATFTLVVHVNANTAAGTTISNTATVSTGESQDANPANNTATATTTVAVQADLSVTKADSPDPVTAGTNLTYTITVSNAGPSDATTVTLSDAIPANTTFVSATQTSGPTFTLATPAVGGTGTFTATIGTFAAGATATFTLVVHVNASATATISNTATVSSTTADTNTANNTATQTTTLNTRADLSVTKTDSPDPVTAGQNITYTITVANAGPSDARIVNLSDVVPVNTTFVSATQTSGPAFTLATPTIGGTGTFTASAGTFAAGASAAFTLVVNVNAATPQGTTVTNTATIASETTDTSAANNTDIETTTVNAAQIQTDLQVTKTDSPDPITAGQNLTYTITVTNAGPNAAQTVNLSDAIPTNTTFVSAAQTAGPAFTLSTPAAGSSTGTVTATAATFASGATATFTMVVNVNAAAVGPISNTAAISSATTDSNTANNSATQSTVVSPVVAQADVSVSKSGVDEVVVGQNLTYTIVVSNLGTLAAQNVTLTDVIPANTTFVSATQTSGPAFTLTTPPAGGTGTFTATIATLAAGASASFTLVVNVDSTAPVGDQISNTATVTTTTTDVNETNNSASSSADIEPEQVRVLVCEVTTANSPGSPGRARLTDDADNPGDNVLIVTGTSANDVIIVEPRPSNQSQIRVKRNGELVGIFSRSAVQHIVVFGLAGNDTIVVNATLSQSATLLGGAGVDFLFGGRGADGLDGGGGDDHLFGGSGNDLLCGGDGNDFVYGQNGNDLVGGDAGNDFLFGEAGNDQLLGASGNDFLYGGIGNDQLFGQTGNDQLFGENGNDILVGGAGNDKLFGGAGRDILIGGSGADQLFGEAHDDILVAGSTAHDQDTQALLAIMAEWSSKKSYSTRVNNIRSGGGANGAFTLDDTTVVNDSSVDTLFGNGDRDWFLLGSRDKVKDRASNELVN